MKPLAEQSLYEILEVPLDAGSGEIAAALDRALSTFGPGALAMYSLMSPDDQATLARRIEEARTTLLDPAARARYDAGLAGSAPTDGARAAPRADLPPVIPALVPERALLSQEEGEEDLEEEEDVPLDAEALAAEVAAPASAPAAAPAAAPASAAAPPPAAPAEEGPPPSERPALTPPPGGHVWPALTPAPLAPALPPAAPPPLLLSAPVAPRPIPLEREVSPPPAARAPAPPAPPAAARTATPREASVPEFAAWSGDSLRSVREARGLSLQQIAERTKVTRHHIENIEGDRYTALPASVYLRGILLSLARELRLDGQKVSRSYLERMASALAPAPPGPPRR